MLPHWNGCFYFPVFTPIRHKPRPVLTCQDRGRKEGTFAYKYRASAFSFLSLCYAGEVRNRRFFSKIVVIVEWLFLLLRPVKNNAILGLSLFFWLHAILVCDWVKMNLGHLGTRHNQMQICNWDMYAQEGTDHSSMNGSATVLALYFSSYAQDGLNSHSQWHAL